MTIIYNIYCIEDKYKIFSSSEIEIVNSMTYADYIGYINIEDDIIRLFPSKRITMTINLLLTITKFFKH